MATDRILWACEIPRDLMLAFKRRYGNQRSKRAKFTIEALRQALNIQEETTNMDHRNAINDSSRWSSGRSPE